VRALATNDRILNGYLAYSCLLLLSVCNMLYSFVIYLFICLCSVLLGLGGAINCVALCVWIVSWLSLVMFSVICFVLF
jgi:hypothetical protein